MTPVTHAFLPLLLGKRWLPRRTNGAPAWIASGWVALSGTLPDILSPHLGLDARHAALSHSFAAWVVFSALLALMAAQRRLRAHRAVICLCGGAYLAHLLCDLITGGIPLLLPIEPEVWGDAWLPFSSWFVLDGVLIVYVYLVYRWLPLRWRIRRPSPGPSAQTEA